MKAILVGNKQKGYEPVNDIRIWTSFCARDVLLCDLVIWQINARHGDRLKLAEDFNNRELICIE